MAAQGGPVCRPRPDAELRARTLFAAQLDAVNEVVFIAERRGKKTFAQYSQMMHANPTPLLNSLTSST